MTTITTKIAESGRTSFQLNGKRASKAAAIEAAIANMKNGSDNLVDIQIAIDAAKKTVRFGINYYGEIIWQEIKSVKQYKSIGGGYYETYYSPEWTRTTEERANELLAEFGLNTEIICKMVFADITDTAQVEETEANNTVDTEAELIKHNGVSFEGFLATNAGLTIEEYRARKAEQQAAEQAEAERRTKIFNLKDGIKNAEYTINETSGTLNDIIKNHYRPESDDGSWDEYTAELGDTLATAVSTLNTLKAQLAELEPAIVEDNTDNTTEDNVDDTDSNTAHVEETVTDINEAEFKFEVGKTYYGVDFLGDVWNNWNENIAIKIRTLKVIKRTAKTITAITENGEQVTKKISIGYHGTTEIVGLMSDNETSGDGVQVTAKKEYTDVIAAAPTDKGFGAWKAATEAAHVEYKPQTAWENPHDFTTVGNLNGQPRKYVDPESIAAPKGFWANRINGTYNTHINGEYVSFENHSIAYIDAEKKLGYHYKKSDTGRKIFYRGNQRFAASKIVEAYMNGEIAAEQNKAHHEFFDAHKTAYNKFFQAYFKVTTADGNVHNFERTFDSFDDAKALVDEFTATFDEPTDILIKRNGRLAPVYYTRTDGLPGIYTMFYFGEDGFDPEVFNLLPALDDLNDVEDEPTDTADDTPEPPVDDFTAELAKLEAERADADKRVSKLNNDLLEAQKAADKASNALYKFGDAKARELARNHLPALGFSKTTAVITQDGDAIDAPNLRHIRIDFNFRKFKFEIVADWTTFGTYDTPEQVKSVIAGLKTAIRHEEKFTFPTVDKLNQPTTTEEVLNKLLLKAIANVSEMQITLQDGNKIRRACFSGAYITMDYYSERLYIQTNWGDTYARYDTPEQVETVINMLKAAIERGDKEFTFPVVDVLNQPSKDDLRGSLKRAIEIARKKYHEYEREGDNDGMLREIELFSICTDAIKELEAA